MKYRYLYGILAVGIFLGYVVGISAQSLPEQITVDEGSNESVKVCPVGNSPTITVDEDQVKATVAKGCVHFNAVDNDIAEAKKDITATIDRKTITITLIDDDAWKAWVRSRVLHISKERDYDLLLRHGDGSEESIAGNVKQVSLPSNDPVTIVSPHRGGNAGTKVTLIQPEQPKCEWLKLSCSSAGQRYVCGGDDCTVCETSRPGRTARKGQQYQSTDRCDLPVAEKKPTTPTPPAEPVQQAETPLASPTETLKLSVYSINAPTAQASWTNVTKQYLLMWFEVDHPDSTLHYRIVDEPHAIIDNLIQGKTYRAMVIALLDDRNSEWVEFDT